MTDRSSTAAERLLTLRAAVLLLTASVMSVVVGVLTHATGAPLAATVLAGLTAFGGSLLSLDTLVGN